MSSSSPADKPQSVAVSRNYTDTVRSVDRNAKWDEPAERVLDKVDYGKRRVEEGAHVEGQSLLQEGGQTVQRRGPANEAQKEIIQEGIDEMKQGNISDGGEKVRLAVKESFGVAEDNPEAIRPREMPQPSQPSPTLGELVEEGRTRAVEAAVKLKEKAASVAGSVKEAVTGTSPHSTGPAVRDGDKETQSPLETLREKASEGWEAVKEKTNSLLGSASPKAATGNEQEMQRPDDFAHRIIDGGVRQPFGNAEAHRLNLPASPEKASASVEAVREKLEGLEHRAAEHLHRPPPAADEKGRSAAALAERAEDRLRMGTGEEVRRNLNVSPKPPLEEGEIHPHRSKFQERAQEFSERLRENDAFRPPPEDAGPHFGSAPPANATPPRRLSPLWQDQPVGPLQKNPYKSGKPQHAVPFDHGAPSAIHGEYGTTAQVEPSRETYRTAGQEGGRIVEAPQESKGFFRSLWDSVTGHSGRANDNELRRG